MLSLSGGSYSVIRRDNFQSHRPILAHLEVLDSPQEMRVAPSSFSHALRVLRVPLNAIPVDFSLLPTLVHLYFILQVPEDGMLQSPDLSALLQLRSLCIEPQDSWSYDEQIFCIQLLECLPTHKICLAFPTIAPLSLLAGRPTLAPPIRVSRLRLPPTSLPSLRSKATLGIIPARCDQAGIDLVFDLIGNVDIFSKFSFSFVQNAPSLMLSLVIGLQRS